GNVDHAEQSRFDLRAEVLHARVFDRSEVAVASVVDEHVETAERVDCRLDRCRRGALVCYVESYRANLVAVALDQRRELFRIPCGSDELVSRSENRFGERTAETARAPSDEPNVILHTCLLCRICFLTNESSVFVCIHFAVLFSAQ